MTAQNLKDLYFSFFTQHNHVAISGKPLIPENDPTVLFTTAGMHPLVAYIQGREHPAGKRLVNVQRCIRTGDIDEVGDASHLTFFEMLGNWSLGDYFKEKSIALSYAFLTDKKYLGISKNDLNISVFAGDDQVEMDRASKKIWLDLGIAAENVHELGKGDNWWGPAGKTGPCGPDTEIFLTLDGKQRFPNGHIELWNNVFMEYNKTEDGRLEPLRLRCVDTGMGLERTATILQGKTSVYECDRIAPLYAAVWDAFSQHSLQDPKVLRLVRIITDHVRAACFIIGDGIHCSNLGQGYVLRRLIRRAVRSLAQLGDDSGDLHRFIPVLVSLHQHDNQQIREKRDEIEQVLVHETVQFKKTLQKGEQAFSKILREGADRSQISGKDAFKLYDTYGFPVELTQELAQEQGLQVDLAGFEQAFAEHKEKSKSLGGGTFKSGLQDHSQKTTALHTATHLLHQALRTILGDHVQQKGSNITPERLRFDFSHEAKMTEDEVHQVEAWINQAIHDHLTVTSKNMTLEEARNQGALAFFNDRYEEVVSVYSIGDVSREVCAGPHVANTAELGKFRIVKEQSSAKGIRRIKAVLE